VTAPAVSIAPELWAEVEGHLALGPDEQLVFLVARWQGDEARAFTARLVQPSGFDLQLPWHLTLADEERAAVITWAHAADGGLIEVHVHRGPWPAEFSPSDRAGLEEFVPHVWWRLRHRPYVALVVADGTLDGLVWRDGPRTPEQLGSLRIGGRERFPTGRSLRRWR